MQRALSLMLLASMSIPLAADDCASEPTPDPNASPDVTVVALEAVHQQFGAGDTRTVRTTVTFPDADQSYSNITMRYSLTCPEGGCDPWDRTAYINVIDGFGTEEALSVEVGRVITPYGVGYSWSMDVTDLRPILTGERTVESFIDTWVNPGWLVDVSFEFVGGTPARKAVAIVPLQRGYYTYGDANDPIDAHLLPVDTTIPEGVSDAQIRVLATGHGFGYTENCAEFCPKEHTLTVGGTADVQTPWRDDCARAGAPGQSGTFWYSRAGWCPGDEVFPRTWEIGELITPGVKQTFGYSLEPYTNSVDGGQPYLIVSSYLILFQ